MLKNFFILYFSLFFENILYAYIGPGMGGGLIAATLGIVIAIIASIFGLLWFPIKRFVKKKQYQKLNKKPKKEEK
tara:strand:+ start:1007 stop:1231 length:225 start_codon:yes stop_codon:yes gene_type:complete